MLCDSMIRKSGCSAEQGSVINDFVQVEHGMGVPFTCDQLLDCFLDFVKKGRSHHQATKLLRLTGDTTRDKTSLGLNKLLLGVVGTHFHIGKLSNTILPIMFVADVASTSTKNLKAKTNKGI